MSELEKTFLSHNTDFFFFFLGGGGGGGYGYLSLHCRDSFCKEKCLCMLI